MNNNTTLLNLFMERYLKQNYKLAQENINQFKNQLISELEYISNPLGIDLTILSQEMEEFIQLNVSLAPVKTTVLNGPNYSEWVEELNPAWERWYRFRRYLLQYKHRSPKEINVLHETTSKIIKNIGNPRDTTFKRKGLVVGYVQSGKTENYITLANKAFDLSYNVVIVLAGLHNDLRSQTQLRLDKELAGRDSILFTEIGVSEIEQIDTHMITNANPTGDIHNMDTNNIVQLINTKTPTVIITKKKDTSLMKLNEIVSKIADDISVLIIDDECDQASIDTATPPAGMTRNDVKYVPSTINGLIRLTLKTLNKVTYVGYTATPNANVLIDHRTNHPFYGPDLFPNDFIVLLPKNPNYIGPEELFGLNDDPGLPLIRFITEETQDSLLSEAISAFIISSATRALRGQENAHNSMLVHINRLTEEHVKVSSIVREKFDDIKSALQSEDLTIKNAVIDSLAELWENDYLLTSEALQLFNHSERWEDVLKQIYIIINKIEIMTINGNSDEALNYEKYKEEGLNVIAIGGDKLSRGLTLEGLTVSFYMRDSKAYDTLMQMGRWFGYKESYKDLCRLYLTKELSQAFSEISLSNYDFYESLEKMDSRNAKPTDFGLRILSSDTRGVTQANKMQDATLEVLLQSLSGRKPQIIYLPKKKDDIIANFELTETFINDLGNPDKCGENRYTLYWNDLDTNSVKLYLEEFIAENSSKISSPREWAKYISYIQENGGFQKMDVVLMSKSRGLSKKISVHEIIPSERTIYKDDTKPGYYYISTLRAGKDLSNLSEFLDNDNLTNPVLLIYLVTLKGTNSEVQDDISIGLSMIFPENDSTPTIIEVLNSVEQEQLSKQ